MDDQLGRWDIMRGLMHTLGNNRLPIIASALAWINFDCLIKMQNMQFLARANASIRALARPAAARRAKIRQCFFSPSHPSLARLALVASPENTPASAASSASTPAAPECPLCSAVSAKCDSSSSAPVPTTASQKPTGPVLRPAARRCESIVVWRASWIMRAGYLSAMPTPAAKMPLRGKSNPPP